MPATPQKIEKVREHPLFKQLVEKQQAFVVAFLQTEDKVNSIYSAGYKSKSDKLADFLARKMLKHSLIKQLIALGLGYETSGGEMSKKELLLLLSDAMRKCKNPQALYRLVVIFTDLKRWCKAHDTPDIADVMEHLKKMRQKEGH